MDGDLIAKDFQYEFRGLLFGSETPFMTHEVEGLLAMPTVRDSDQEIENEHGAVPGVPLLSKRTITFDMTILGAAGEDIEQKLALARRAFSLPNKRDFRNLDGFYFRRPGEAKKVCFCRVAQREFKSSFETARGKAAGTVQLVAPDPIIYSAELHSELFILPNGQTQTSFMINNEGDHADGAYPVIRITGPATNPRIQNLSDDGRTIRLDVILNAAQTLLIDVRNRIITIDGVGRFDIRRNDNQWWNIVPGENDIVYSRAAGNIGAGSNFTIEWRDSWQ